MAAAGLATKEIFDDVSSSNIGDRFPDLMPFRSKSLSNLAIAL
jgi:hypothetical protein